MLAMRSKNPVDQQTYNELIGAIYDATLNDSDWSQFLEKAAEATHSDAAAMLMVSRDGVSKEFCFTYNLDKETIQDYKKQFSSLAPLLSSLKKYPNKGGSNECGIFSLDNLRTEPLYRELLESHGFSYFLGNVVTGKREYAILFALARYSSSGEYTQAELDLVNDVFPHLKRALRISLRLIETNQFRTVCGDLLNRLNVGVILVDSKGKYILSNHKASALIAKNGSGVTISGGKIRVSNIKKNELLNNLISRAIEENGNLEEMSGAMTIQRENLIAPLRVLVKPILPSMQATDDNGNRACAIVFLGEDERETEFYPEDVMSLYGLTQAESRLAISIANGLSLNEAAEKYQVSKNTLRSQLRTIHAKMGIKRQNELVSILLLGPARYNLER